MITDLTVPNEHVDHVRDAETAKDIWEKTNNVFERHTLLNRHTARCRFYIVSMDAG